MSQEDVGALRDLIAGILSSHKAKLTDVHYFKAIKIIGSIDSHSASFVLVAPSDVGSAYQHACRHLPPKVVQLFSSDSSCLEKMAVGLQIVPCW